MIDFAERLMGERPLKIAVWGDIILDRYIFGNVQRISPEAPVPVLDVNEQQEMLGGAASVAMLVKAMGAHVDLYGVVGDDVDAKVVRRLLIDQGIGHDAVVSDASYRTTAKERFIGRTSGCHSHQLLRVDREAGLPVGAEVSGLMANRLIAEMDAYDALLVSDYAKGGCVPETLQIVINAARTQQIPILVDPGQIHDYRCYAGADLIVPNRREAEYVTNLSIAGPDDAIEPARRISDMCGGADVAIKLDADGILLVDQGSLVERYPTDAHEVHDVTGAGDTVIAMLGLASAAGIPLKQSVPLANIAAGLQVSRLGVTPIGLLDVFRKFLNAKSSHANKLVDLHTLRTIVDLYHRCRFKVVFTNGCFDLLHAGHVHCLHEMAELGDACIVAINSDASVRRLKGSARPVFSAQRRAEMLSTLECINHVVIFDDDTPHDLLRLLQPDILAKGGTYAPDEVVGRDIVHQYGGDVVVVSHVAGVSTTRIVDEVRRLHDNERDSSDESTLAKTLS